MTSIDQGERNKANAPDRRRLLVAACIGVVLFCAVGIFCIEGLLTFYAFALTPLFSVPLAIELWRQKQIRWQGGTFLVLGLTLFHFAAIQAADKIYSQGITYFLECGLVFNNAPSAEVKTHRECESRAAAARRHNAPRAGLAGGITGAALSYAGLLLLGSRFRSRRKVAVMLGATFVLGLIGAAGMSLTFPDDMRSWQWIVQIYLPWQTVFALSLVYLFGGSSTLQLRR